MSEQIGAQGDQRNMNVPSTRNSKNEGPLFREASPGVSVYRLYTTLLNQNALPDSGDTKKFLDQGLVLSNRVKELKRAGKEFLTLQYTGMRGDKVTLKIRINGENIATDELTKDRFLAVLHIHNFKSQFNHRSGLTMRLDFTEVDWEFKTMFMALLGAGFQFQGKFIIEDLKLDEVKKDEAIRIYWALCHVMDYLSITGKLLKDKRLAPKLKKFSIFDYMENPEYYMRAVPGVSQAVVNAAARNIGLEGLSIIQESSMSNIAKVLTKLPIEDSSLVWRGRANDNAIRQIAMAAQILMKREGGNPEINNVALN